MSGKRHHYIPRFLQKGFSNRSYKKNFYSYVYKIDHEVFESNINNIGVESYFYGHPSVSSVDDNITKEEASIAKTLDGLRTQNINEKINNKDVCYFLASFSSRTKHSRNIIYETYSNILSEILSFASSPGILDKVLLKHIQRNKQEVRDMIYRAIEERELVGMKAETKNLVANFVFNNAPAFIESKSEDNYQQFLSLLSPIDGTLEGLTYDTHLNLLSDTLDPHNVEIKLSNMEWRLREPIHDKFILGDVGPWVVSGDTDENLPLSFATLEISKVYFPISKDRILVGTNPKYNNDINEEIINFYTASLSSNFFISSEQTDILETLQQGIGKSLYLAIKSRAIEFRDTLNDRL